MSLSRCIARADHAVHLSRDVLRPRPNLTSSVTSRDEKCTHPRHCGGKSLNSLDNRVRDSTLTKYDQTEMVSASRWIRKMNMKSDLVALATAMQRIGSRALLRELHRSGECDHVARDRSMRIATGWREIDVAIGGGLLRGMLHEWFADDAAPRSASIASRAPWPALSVLVHLAWRALESEDGCTLRQVIWIGRACWPYPAALIRAGDDDRRLLQRSIFVDPADDAQRVWAIDQSLRSPATLAVIADARGVDMAESRRLQLAAEAPIDINGRERGGGGGGDGGDGGDGRVGLALMVRAPSDRARLSTAGTRWLVRPQPSHIPRHGGHQQLQQHWSIELLRCKGARANIVGGRSWTVRHDEQTNGLHLSADVADRSGEAPASEVPAAPPAPAAFARRSA